MTVANLSKNQADSVSSGIRSLKGRKTFAANVSKEISDLDKELMQWMAKCVFLCVVNRLLVQLFLAIIALIDMATNVKRSSRKQS